MFPKNRTHFLRLQCLLSYLSCNNEHYLRLLFLGRKTTNLPAETPIKFNTSKLFLYFLIIV